jgi:sulfate permease, SulP family
VVWWDNRLLIIALGGRSRLSTFVSGAFLLVLIFILKDIVVKIPMAALVGVMIMVAFETFDWKSLKLFRELAPSQAVIMPITMVFALWTHDEREGGCSGFGG